jgi:ABC-type branched-subunit amino acid transport system substrate-binding protein
MTHGHRNKRAILSTAGVLALSAIVTLTACSSGSSSAAGSKTTTESAAASKPTGSAINIGFIDSLSGTPYADPHQSFVAKMAVDATNDSGGINGHPLNMIVCATKGSASAAQACAQKLVDDDHVVAFIGNSSAGGVADVGKAAGVVAWGPMADDPSDINNPLSFLMDTSAVGAATAAYLGAKRFNAKSAAIIGVQGADTFTQQAVYGFNQAGITDVKIFTAPPTSDYTPYLQKVKSSGVDVWTIMPSSATIGPAIQQATQLGVKQPVALFDNAMSNAALQALASAPFANSIALEKAESPSVPTWNEYLQQLKKYAPGGSIDNTTDGSVTGSWIDAWSFAQVAKKITGPVTAASFRAYVSTLTDFDTGIMHPLDFTKPGLVPNMPRQVNVWSYEGHAANGQTVLDSTTPFSPYESTPISAWTPDQVKAATGS